MMKFPDAVDELTSDVLAGDLATDSTLETFNDWGGGMPEVCTRFWRGRHKNSPSGGLI